MLILKWYAHKEAPVAYSVRCLSYGRGISHWLSPTIPYQHYTNSIFILILYVFNVLCTYCSCLGTDENEYHLSIIQKLPEIHDHI